MHNHRTHQHARLRRLAVEAVEERTLLSAALQIDSAPIIIALANTVNYGYFSSSAGVPSGTLTAAELKVGLLSLDYVAGTNAFCDAIIAGATSGSTRFQMTTNDSAATITPIVPDGTPPKADGDSTSAGGTPDVVRPPLGPSGPLPPPAEDAHPEERGDEPSVAPPSPLSPTAAPRLRITAADLHSPPRQVGMLDTTPRVQEASVLALAKAGQSEPLAHASERFPWLTAPQTQANPAATAREAAPAMRVNDSPSERPREAAGAQPLDGSRGRCQAFDLAAQEAASTPTDAVAEEPLASALPVTEPAAATAVPADAAASRSFVFAELDNARALFLPVRLDGDQRARSVLPLLALTALTLDLAERREKESGVAPGTSLYPRRRAKTPRLSTDRMEG